jgi:hypothetical protein
LSVEREVEMASFVHRLLFLVVVLGAPLAGGFLVTPGSWGDERFDIPDAALPSDRPQRVAGLHIAEALSDPRIAPRQ